MNTTDFSTLLSNYIKHSSYNIKQLAEETSINRTALQKYISGNRFPSNYAQIEIIADKLTLSEAQKHILFNAYKIKKVGYQQFEYLQLLKKILNKINDYQEIKENHFQINYTFENMYSFVDNKNDLLILIRYILDQTKKSTHHHLKVYIPADEDIYQIIYNNLKSDSSLLIDMLIQISLSKSHAADNMILFQKIMPFLFFQRCQIRYVYENHDTILKHNMSFPYLISNDLMTLLINTNLSAGILLEENVNNYVTNQFDLLFSQSNAYNRHISSNENILSYYETIYQYDPSLHNICIYSFAYEPWVIPHIDQYIFKTHYTGDKAIASRFEKILTDYKDSVLLHIKEGKKCVFYFSQSGLESFYSTGKITNIPEYLYKPFSKNEVIQILKRIVTLAKNYPNYLFYMLKEEKFNFPSNFNIIINNTDNLFFTLSGKLLGSPVYITLLEPVSKNLFNSLLDLVELEECCHSFEDSCQFLEQFIEQHK